MANYNLTGQKIKDTYPQLAQVNDSNLLVDGLGVVSPILTSSIINFPTEVSRSAAAAGFGAGGGGVSEATFTTYTSSNDSKVNSLISATSSYALKTAISGAFVLPSGVVSSSAQVSYSGITGVPSGIVSSSAQVSYSGITGVPSGLVSSSAQVIAALPAGTVSSSAQILPILTSSITNFPTEVSRSAAAAGFGSGGGVATDTGSLLVTASFSNPNLTFTKGDGTTFQQSLVSLVPTSASFAQTSSFANEFNVATNLKVGNSFSAGGSNPVTNTNSLSFGVGNTIGADNSMIIGAENNTNNAQFCAIVGAANSTISAGDTSVILGGYQNTINGGLRGIIIGGNQVTNGQDFSVVLGKQGFTATKPSTTYVDNFESTGSLNHSGSVQVVGSVSTPTTTLVITSNTASVNAASSNFFTLNAAGNPFLLKNPTNLKDGSSYTFRIISGSGCVFDSNYLFESGSVSGLSTNKVDILSFVSIGGSQLYGVKLLNLQ